MINLKNRITSLNSNSAIFYRKKIIYNVTSFLKVCIIAYLLKIFYLYIFYFHSVLLFL